LTNQNRDEILLRTRKISSLFFISKLIKIPTPKFVVLYNGSTDMEEEEYLKLSDAFEHKEDIPTLELVVCEI
jgi:hypothetical protein